jgi:myb proto-oncogene protein
MLKEAVRKYGPNAWHKVADVFENDRSELQCQLRWQKVLNPSVIKGPWTKEVCVRAVTWFLSVVCNWPLAFVE